MTQASSFSETGLYGSGLLIDAAGESLRPGGTELSEKLISTANFPSGELVVDIGCGRGTSLARLLSRDCAVLGVDMAADALAAARQAICGVRVVRACGTELPLRTASVGGILAECSLSLMSSRRTALAEWARVLRPGAVLAIGDVFARHPLGNDEGVAGIAGQKTLIRELSSVGLSVLCFEDCSDVLKPWVARFIFCHGTLDSLWTGACGLSAETVRRAAIGYFLTIARRSTGGCDV